jgi:endonuclease/exonuclease/phosphatase family metal-dependent hydrolase
MRLRAATYNIRKALGLDWRRRPDRILAVLDEIGADVVALQEADRRFGARAAAIPPMMLEEAGWRVARVAAHTGGIGWLGNAILLGPRAALAEARPLILPGLEPRGAAYAELLVEGRRLNVVGMHLGLTAGPRRRQIETVLEAVARTGGGPTLLMGDMNEPRRRGGALRLFEPHWSLAPPAPSFHARRPIAALDRIAYGPGLRLLDGGAHRSLLAREASDHLPVFADFALEPET